MRCRWSIFGGVCVSFLLIYLFRIIFFRPDRRKVLTESDIEHLTTLNVLDRPDHSIRIPRIIHQTWKTRNVPPKWNVTVQTIINANAQHFEYRLWTDKDMHAFVREKDPEFYHKTFRTYRLDIQRVDAFRYFVLFYQGGLYIDMDNGCRQSLHTLFNALELLDPKAKHYCAFPLTVPVGVSNGFMISTPGHPLFRQLMSHLSLFDHNFIVDYLTVMLSAGPLYLSLHEFYFRSPLHVSVRCIDDIVYSTIYTWHTQGSSWHGRDAKVVLFLYQKIRLIPFWLFIILLLAIIVFCFCLFRLLYRKSRQFCPQRMFHEN